VEITTTISIGEQPQATQISVYPTLVENSLFVYTSEPVSDVDIYSIMGVRVKSFHDHAGGAIDLSDLQRGMYIIRVSTEMEKSTLRIIKE
jgi:hypothetical protein